MIIAKTTQKHEAGIAAASYCMVALCATSAQASIRLARPAHRRNSPKSNQDAQRVGKPKPVTASPYSNAAGAERSATAACSAKKLTGETTTVLFAHRSDVQVSKTNTPNTPNN